MEIAGVVPNHCSKAKYCKKMNHKFGFRVHKKLGIFLGCPVVRALPLQWVRVHSLVREIRLHMLSSQKTKT